MSQTSDATLKQHGHATQRSCDGTSTATRGDGRLVAPAHAQTQCSAQRMLEAQQQSTATTTMTEQRISESSPGESLGGLMPMVSEVVGAVATGRDSTAAAEEADSGTAAPAPSSSEAAAAAAEGSKMYTTRRQRRRIVQWMGGVGDDVCCVCSTPTPMPSSAPSSLVGAAAAAAGGIGVKGQASWTAAFRTKTTTSLEHDTDDADGRQNHGGDPGSGAERETATSVGRMKSGTAATCGTCRRAIDASVSVDGMACRRDSADAVGMGRRMSKGLLLRSLRRLLVRDIHDTTAISAAGVPGNCSSSNKPPLGGDAVVSKDHTGSNSSESGTDSSSDHSAGTLAWLEGDDSSGGGGGGKGKGNRGGGKPVLDLDEKAARLRRAQKLLGKSDAAG